MQNLFVILYLRTEKETAEQSWATENFLHRCDKRVVIIRTCHLVTTSAQTKGSHRGRGKHQVSYGDEQGKKFSSVAIGPSARSPDGQGTLPSGSPGF